MMRLIHVIKNSIEIMAASMVIVSHILFKIAHPKVIGLMLSTSEPKLC